MLLIKDKNLQLLPLTSAFDLVNTDIFLDKMAAYNAGSNTVAWIKSYLTSRKKRVFVDGHLSDELPFETGVPQGSILGPLFYIIYTSDLPLAIHDGSNLVNICEECGHLCCYADDSTYTVSSQEIGIISQKISSKYSEISTYMRNNKLVLNSDKTHLVVMASAHKHRKYENF